MTGGWPARSLGPVRPGRPSGPGPGLCNNASRAAPRTGQLGRVLLLSTPRGWVMMEQPAKVVLRDLDRPCQRAPLEGTSGRCAQSLQVRQDAGQGIRDTGSHPLWTAPPSSAWHQGPLVLEGGSRGRLTQPGRLSQSRRGPGMGEGGWDGGGGRLHLRLGLKLVLATQWPLSHAWLRLPGPQVGTQGCACGGAEWPAFPRAAREQGESVMGVSQRGPPGARDSTDLPCSASSWPKPRPSPGRPSGARPTAAEGLSRCRGDEDTKYPVLLENLVGATT